ncbi:2-oxo acid dehydrogenase subunit E2 [Streptomyces sp. YS415]|uniref:2-oxo acid dehydrogenase subunit E2 n=1 Tax=Streptomyces sp. YS415 TaxID=2944806 RepID=UPI00202037F4|nr:2-oxo acid dehydrogenase subunit E2 [Streptomyces sp. YS415]MCL7427067.1 2-oxo acid dehydrogenase subunit E2 [Streptomyces sp. YS415]
MPKLNSNDAVHLLAAWAVADGGKAVAGEPLLEVETSKALEEVAAPTDGLLEQVAEPGREYPPGALLARLHADEEALAAARGRTATGPEPARAGADVTAAAPGPVVTQPARALLAELGIPESRARELGVPVVRRADVERLVVGAAGAGRPGADHGTSATAVEAAAFGDTSTTAALSTAFDEPSTSVPAFAAGAADAVPDAGPPGTVVTPLTRVQRAVAATVTVSHRTVPAAFTVVEADLTDALAAGRKLSAAAGSLVGPAELALAALAVRREHDPACFASLTPDGTATRLLPGAHIGVTFDVGAGLYVPVVRDADRAGLGGISRTLMTFRMAAVRGAFRESDLNGANITLTLHTEPGVVFAVPVVFPGQACALSLAAPRAVAVPDGAGGFRERSLVQLGAAYDHRLVNGRDVTALLTGVRDLLQDPARLAEAMG